VVAGCVITAIVTSAGAPGRLAAAQWAHIVWADREALGRAIAEIDTTAVLTRHDRPIDNHGVEMGASAWAPTVATTADDESPRDRCHLK
jgi:hypothetical protein